MLVWVGADVAGDALVVWEAEAGPVAQDPVAALGVGRRAGSVMGRQLSHTPQYPFPPWTGSELLPPLEDLTLEETFQITEVSKN